MKQFATIALVALLTCSARAQLTITSSEFFTQQGQLFNVVSDTSTDVTGIAGVLATSGTDKTWDITGRAFHEVAQSAITMVLPYPGEAALADDPDFKGATHVIVSTPFDHTQPITYTFVTLNANGLWQLGFTQDSAGIKTKVFGYSPGEQQYKFPLQYQTAWSSTSDVHSDLLPPGATITNTSNYVVDGYGTLIIPPARSSAALRIRQNTQQTISIFGFNQQLRSTGFEWVTKSNVSAGIGADSNEKPQTVTYSAAPASGVVSPELLAIAQDPLTLRLSSNPASSSETISYTMKSEGPAKISIMDELGRNVRMLLDGRATIGENLIPIDPKAFAAGTYFIHVAAEGLTATRKLIISH